VDEAAAQLEPVPAERCGREHAACWRPCVRSLASPASLTHRTPCAWRCCLHAMCVALLLARSLNFMPSGLFAGGAREDPVPPNPGSQVGWARPCAVACQRTSLQAGAVSARALTPCCPCWRPAAPAPLRQQDVPQGHPDAFTGKAFVFSGVLSSLFREAAKDLVLSLGGRVTSARVCVCGGGCLHGSACLLAVCVCLRGSARACVSV
jgi:hypothetical protein